MKYLSSLCHRHVVNQGDNDPTILRGCPCLSAEIVYLFPGIPLQALLDLVSSTVYRNKQHPHQTLPLNSALTYAVINLEYSTYLSRYYHCLDKDCIV